MRVLNIVVQHTCNMILIKHCSVSESGVCLAHFNVYIVCAVPVFVTLYYIVLEGNLQER